MRKYSLVMAVYRCSYKKATALVCLINVAAAVYVLNAVLLAPSISSSAAVSWQRRRVLGFSAQEANRILEAHAIRRKVEPHKLIQRVKEIQNESDRKSSGPVAIREQAALDILQRLRQIQYNQTNAEALREWRRKKLQARGHSKEANRSTSANDMNKAIAQEEVAKLLELGWLHNNAAEPPSSDTAETGEILATVTGPEVEDGIIPGRILPPECRGEAHTDYDGVAVRWGLTHHTESAADCCQACFDQAKSAKGDEKKCNVWVFCAAENGCYSPDIYEHKHQECWLKQADQPKLNFKGHYDEEYRQTHPNAPAIVPWVSGVIRE